MRKIFFYLCVILGLPLWAESTSVPAEMIGGFPVANFAISAQMPESGDAFGFVWCNTGRLGGWLENCGQVHMSLRIGEKYYALEAWRLQEVKRTFPSASKSFRKHEALKKISLKVDAFSPLVLQDAEESALPVVMVDVDLEGLNTVKDSIMLVVEPEKGDMIQAFGGKGEKPDGGGRLEMPVEVGKDGCAKVEFALVHYDATWVAAQRFDNAEEVAHYALNHKDMLRLSAHAFGETMPRCGEKEIDEYLPYYLLPALILTRINNEGQALTMGYCELNQRDSFWTSWLHLVCYRDLERKMIEESYAAMRASGKIPTCILPEIERWDDLDINLFLILRTARYFAYWKDRGFLRKVWPQACRAMDWVTSRDLHHVGMPEQVSFWGDWKDVRYMQERMYSPFVEMLYLAALDQMSKMAQVCNDNERSEFYKSLYDKSFSQVNKSTEEGGLWNGRYYAQVWKDGSVKEMLCQDQMVGVLYGVIPEDRAKSIVETLNEKALTPYGICNQWPYLPGVEYPEATYHNGAMWPWTSFMDCWARLRMGRSEEVKDLLGRIFRADIVESGDFVPNEHINTQTGENLGFPVQGWNANLYGLMYFGLCYPQCPFKL